MTCLTALAHTARAQAAAFNGLLYATVATIIPVLFLALAVQGGGYESFLREALQIARAQDQGQSPFNPIGRVASRLAPKLPLHRVPRIMLIVAFIILTAGFVGEASAITALDGRHDDSVTRITVLVATFILLFAVVTGPLQAYIRTTLSMPGGPLAPPAVLRVDEPQPVQAEIGPPASPTPGPPNQAQEGTEQEVTQPDS